ncbi:MAG: HD domain-containing phosphohydrolase [Solirubrobacteraceae bacterium]
MDDEPEILEALRDTLRRSFEVHTATSGAEGLEKLAAAPAEFALVISDMRMPVMSGTVFLAEARRVAPDAARILLTGYADLDAAVRAVNEAQLFRFLTKPCESEALLRACAAGVGQHRLQTAERVLLEQTLKGSVQALVDVLALASPAAFGRSRRVSQIVGRFVQTLELKDAWEIEVSALLVDVGAVTLPEGTAEKLYAGQRLSETEQSMVKRVPAATQRILENIPRLEGVLEILAGYQEPYESIDPGRSASVGARILRIALDYDALEARCGERDAALAIMRRRAQAYDPYLLEKFARVIGLDTPRRPSHVATGPQTQGQATAPSRTGSTHNPPADDPDRDVILEISLRQLRPGMQLADDVRSGSGSLLIARGQTVTGPLIERIENHAGGFVREPLRVLVANTAAS